MPDSLISDTSSYFMNEQWFELKRFYSYTYPQGEELERIRVINSYGRVRDLYPNGTYKDIHEGKSL